MKVVILPGLTLPRVTETDIERIKVAGATEVVVTDLDKAQHHVHDADVILGIVPRELFVHCQQLKWIQGIASGVDMFFYHEFVQSDVMLTSEKGLVGEHLADHAFGLLLMLTRQLHTALRLGPSSWHHRWEMRRHEVELTDLTMGIFGFGGTGRAMARRAHGFGMQVVALDRDPVPSVPEVAAVWGSDRFDDLLQTSDVLAICCPLTHETRGLFGKDEFAKLKKSAFFVNVTRGEVFDEDALVESLTSNRLAGAALDVVPREPLPADSKLWQLPNVVMSPHTAGASQFRAKRNLERFLRNVANFDSGKPLEGLIDKELGY